MTKNSLTVTILATVIAVSFALQLACGKHDPLNSNDQAQVASARNAEAPSPSNNNTAAAPPFGTPATSDGVDSVAKVERVDVERDPEHFRHLAASRGGHIGNGPDDLWLWVTTNLELTINTELIGSKIEVDVVHGVVTLRGIVASRRHSRTATRIVRNIKGVKDVVNSLAVSLPE